MSSERKCQAGCGHPMEMHDGVPIWCRECRDSAETIRDTRGRLAAMQASYHPFETLTSLRAEVEACLAAHTAFVTKVENVVGRWPGDRHGDGAVITALLSFRTERNNADHAHLQAAARAAALTAERDVLRDLYQACVNSKDKLLHERDGWQLTANEVNERNENRKRELSAEVATLRQLVLTDEALAEIVEPLAAIAHSQWSGWMQHMFGRLGYRSDTDSEPRTISDDDHRRWQRQSALSYAELPESEKESDRAEARKYIDAIRAARGVKEKT